MPDAEQDPATRERHARRGPSARVVAIIAALLSLVVVAALVVAGLMWSRVRADQAQEARRQDAVSAAQQFALRMDNFSGAKIDDYIKGIDELLTTKARTEFGKQFEQFKQVYAQGNAAGTGEVLLSGVGDADQDSATVLVVHDQSVKSDFGSQVRHYRWTVSLDKVKGTWRVDDFSPVN